MRFPGFTLLFTRACPPIGLVGIFRCRPLILALVSSSNLSFSSFLLFHSDNHLTSYWNSLAVQLAINAVPPGTTTPIAWTECSSVVNYDFNSVATSVIPVLEQLMAEPGKDEEEEGDAVCLANPVDKALLCTCIPATWTP